MVYGKRDVKVGKMVKSKDNIWLTESFVKKQRTNRKLGLNSKIISSSLLETGFSIVFSPNSEDTSTDTWVRVFYICRYEP